MEHKKKMNASKAWHSTKLSLHLPNVELVLTILQGIRANHKVHRKVRLDLFRFVLHTYASTFGIGKQDKLNDEYIW